MPIYEYRCDDCAGTFERLAPFAERDLPQSCPVCQSPKTRIAVSSFAALGPGEFSSTLPMASRPAAGGCCGGACGCGH